jgi:hypothetical protein
MTERKKLHHMETNGGIKAKLPISYTLVKSKAVRHTYAGAGGREGMAPIHS